MPFFYRLLIGFIKIHSTKSTFVLPVLFRLPVMLPFHRWQSNHHEFRRHHMVSHRNANTDMQASSMSSSADLCLNTVRSAPVHCGTSRRASRPRFSLGTLAMSWACPCRLTSALLCRGPATLRSNCGTSGTACAGRLSQATSRTSTPSVWVWSVSRTRTVQGSNNQTADHCRTTSWATAAPSTTQSAKTTAYFLLKFS